MSHSAMSSAPIAQIRAPRRPVIFEPLYSFCHSASGSSGFAPTSISRSPRPMMCVPPPSMQARATHGLVSVSPMPVMPSSVCISTTRLSCADEQASVS